MLTHPKGCARLATVSLYLMFYCLLCLEEAPEPDPAPKYPLLAALIPGIQKGPTIALFNRPHFFLNIRMYLSHVPQKNKKRNGTN
jgi:hypothetical protein